MMAAVGLPGRADIFVTPSLPNSRSWPQRSPARDPEMGEKFGMGWGPCQRPIHYSGSLDASMRTSLVGLYTVVVQTRFEEHSDFGRCRYQSVRIEGSFCMEPGDHSVFSFSDNGYTSWEQNQT